MALRFENNDVIIERSRAERTIMLVSGIVFAIGSIVSVVAAFTDPPRSPYPIVADCMVVFEILFFMVLAVTSLVFAGVFKLTLYGEAAGYSLERSIFGKKKSHTGSTDEFESITLTGGNPRTTACRLMLKWRNRGGFGVEIARYSSHTIALADQGRISRLTGIPAKSAGSRSIRRSALTPPYKSEIDSKTDEPVFRNMLDGVYREAFDNAQLSVVSVHNAAALRTASTALGISILFLGACLHTIRPWIAFWPFGALGCAGLCGAVVGFRRLRQAKYAAMQIARSLASETNPLFLPAAQKLFGTYWPNGSKQQISVVAGMLLAAMADPDYYLPEGDRLYLVRRITYLRHNACTEQDVSNGVVVAQALAHYGDAEDLRAYRQIAWSRIGNKWQKELMQQMEAIEGQWEERLAKRASLDQLLRAADSAPTDDLLKPAQEVSGVWKDADELGRASGLTEAERQA